MVRKIVMSNLGYQFQSQEYYLKKTKVKDDVKAITDFKMSGHIKTMIERRCEELGELVKSNDMTLDNCSFQAEVNYPGLVVGLSNPIMCNLKNDLKEDKDNQNAAFKTGFSFDYTTGLPYISGSSIKGMLRASILKYREDVIAWLHKNIKTFEKKEIVLDNLVAQLFGNGNTEDTIETKKQYTQVLDRDVFLDVLVICGDTKDGEGKILKSDYITPHPSMFKNPKPIHILALRPNVKLQFYFLLRPEAIAGISSEKRFELYKNLILDLGIGAKTNTGYGSLTEVKKTREERHGNKR